MRTILAAATAYKVDRPQKTWAYGQSTLAEIRRLLDLRIATCGYFLFQQGAHNIVMDISLKDTKIAGYWATARENTLDDCVSELHHFMTLLESLSPGGHWRIMREAPQRLGQQCQY